MGYLSTWGCLCRSAASAEVWGWSLQEVFEVDLESGDGVPAMKGQRQEKQRVLGSTYGSSNFLSTAG